MRTFLLLLVMAVSGMAAGQNIVYFPGFEMINVPDNGSLQYATSKLLKAYIEDNHEYAIILGNNIIDEGFNVQESQTTTAKEALEINARFFMRGEIHFLQGVYIVSVGVYDAQTSERVWHDLAKGSVEKDLDPLLSRLGRSFLTDHTAKTDINIDEVTEYEQQGIELAQIKVNHFVGIMLGGKHVPNETILSGVGLAYTYDASTFLFNFDFELYPTSNLLASTLSDTRKIDNGTVNLGVTYPLTRKRNTFYVNGGMEYGYTRVRDEIFEAAYIETRAGIGAFAGGGFLINRNSTVNLRIYVAATVPFYESDGTNLTGFKFGIVTSFAK